MVELLIKIEFQNFDCICDSIYQKKKKNVFEVTFYYTKFKLKNNT